MSTNPINQQPPPPKKQQPTVHSDGSPLRFVYRETSDAKCGASSAARAKLADACATLGCAPCQYARDAAAKAKTPADAATKAALAACADAFEPAKGAAAAGRRAAAGGQPAQQLLGAEGFDIPGNDVPCNGALPPAAPAGDVAAVSAALAARNAAGNCRVCGDVAAVRAKCAAVKGCLAFAYNGKSKCGYLKGSLSGMVPREGWSAYHEGKAARR